MSTPKLKIGPLPDRTPVKVTVNVEPVLYVDLQIYAELYEEAYGQHAKVEDLIPSMVQSFLAGDAALKREAKKRQAQQVLS
jgi:hypothetical protein